MQSPTFAFFNYFSSPVNSPLASIVSLFMGKNTYKNAFLGAVFWTCLIAGAWINVASGAEWMELNNCRFISNGINDGDSFMIKHNGTPYVFRLYWVDTPEERDDYPARLREQAEYFGITPKEVEQIGREAKLFTREFLKGNLTIYTQWENGQGTGQRYYAVVNSDKGNLIEALVKRGLARIYGYIKAWPEEKSIDQFRRRLWKLEKQAKEDGRGAWASGIDVWDPFDYQKKLAALPDLEGKLNINTATKEELVLLPGIGLTYSQRIIAARPFRSIEDLIKVKGIGPKTFARIKDRVSIKD
ncbi:MAG: helix-hairpin-helix domain-containing protein [Verrucomicrobia bacterium]|nr:helix-hairpin-helix domain-containing protein [Verrucomicrobiota bacterium]